MLKCKTLMTCRWSHSNKVTLMCPYVDYYELSYPELFSDIQVCLQVHIYGK